MMGERQYVYIHIHTHICIYTHDDLEKSYKYTYYLPKNHVHTHIHTDICVYTRDDLKKYIYTYCLSRNHVYTHISSGDTSLNHLYEIIYLHHPESFICVYVLIASSPSYGVALVGRID